jgi:hypothetical protein
MAAQITNGDYWRNVAEVRGVPLRTLYQVRAALDLAKLNDTDRSMARLMLRHGRLTDDARDYIAREYPQ